ncbi:cytochrome P450 [Phascolomyces articulosus]|uniref:Cytochrome P450 n=1 Tax=Phascolomyces articulosus TaxID=60185 RepID=A0AAD5PHZ6_9FUNG|nr:cytochrome P450 [Phascolomyces articulosus]
MQYIIGHLLNFIIKMQAHKLKVWHDELGPVIRLQIGAQPWIVVSDPSIVHYLFTTNGTTSSNRPYQILSAHYYSRDNSGIAFGKANTRWRRLRTIAASSALSPAAVSKHMKFIRSEAVRLAEELISSSTQSILENKNGINPLGSFRRASLNYVFRAVFGTCIESGDDPRLQSALDFTDQTNMLIGTHKDFEGFLPILSYINSWLPNRGNKLLGEFLRTRDPFLRAATNVGYGSAWLIAILLHHPDVYKDLCNEVDAFIRTHEGRLPDFSERDQLPLLTSCQKESMRFRGTNDVTLPHLIEKDVNYKGYLFPKGVLVLPSAYAMHRDPDRYPDPEKFIATRFLSNNKTMAASAAGKVEDRDHFMFGFGRRICPAMHLAEVQMFILVTNILARCDLKPPLDRTLPDLDDGRDAGAVMSPPPFKVIFTKRENSLLK